VNIDRSKFLAIVTALAGSSVVACGGAPAPAQTAGPASDTAAPATPAPLAPASAATVSGPAPAPAMAQAPATTVSQSGSPADAPVGVAPGGTDAPAAPAASAPDAVDATGPAPGVVAGLDVLGVRIGMPIAEATAVLKAKGIHPAGEGCGYAGNNACININVMTTTPAQLVREISQTDSKKMFASDVASALRAKYGGNGIDSGAAATKGFARPTRESCSKTLDARASCKTALAAKKDANPQNLQVCAEEREQSCSTYQTADQKPQAQGGHSIVWYYDEHGRPLSLEGFQRYCPPRQDCRAVVVSAHFGDPDGAGTIGGYGVGLASPWLLKRDNDEVHRREVEAQKAAERKQREEEINLARKNKPSL
jgi:hypothetical protein